MAGFARNPEVTVQDLPEGVAYIVSDASSRILHLMNPDNEYVSVCGRADTRGDRMALVRVEHLRPRGRYRHCAWCDSAIAV